MSHPGKTIREKLSEKRLSGKKNHPGKVTIRETTVYHAKDIINDWRFFVRLGILGNFKGFSLCDVM